MKKLLVIQSNYIPWKGYFDAINAVDEFILHDDRQYTKNDWRNRNKIKTTKGPEWLSIPVKIKSVHLQRIDEAQVADPQWNKSHWQKIQANYSKAPFFKEYKDLFAEMYNTQETYLSKINYHFITSINKLLGITTPIRWSTEFNLTDVGKNERLIDLCHQTGTTDYYSGPAAKNYMNEALFKEAGINVHWLDYSGYPVYSQLHGEFTHELSIIDLIFNEGPNAKNFLKSFTGKPMVQKTNISAAI